ncbi:pentatricopeptide repeat-containing protein ELI1, chloroplastic-like [Macadamia integrifolia]|uniref:pentatricopeptide repeat-containing protein ELI1, chloroplastic-like n=1 Tax=Macadamia integrifolia TaxID=60698 RepID=UPI001C4FDABD|nr:pentatricopeptide repeat-containing protein ELI1, chloroplastic-like [Macadamia integrifolia]
MASPPLPSLLKPNQMTSSGKPITRTVRIPADVILTQKKTRQNIQETQQLHAQLIVSGRLNRHPTATKKLIESYALIPHIPYAYSVFKSINSPNIFMYNTMIRYFILGNHPFRSVFLYQGMLSDGLVPDNHTYTFVLKACSKTSSLFEGKQVHCQIIKTGLKPSLTTTHIHSSLIHMYANANDLCSAECVLLEFSEYDRNENTLVMNSMLTGYMRNGWVENARQLFERMSVKDDASWSVMISGFVQNSMNVEALGIFQEMIVSGTPLPNESALVSSLSACAQLGALNQGRWIHAYVKRSRIKLSVRLCTALVDMYAKCGSIDIGYQVFEKMPRRDVVAWGVMISGFAMHVRANECFKLFDEMVSEGLYPNAIIFVSILSACSHAGCVEAGCYYFDRLSREFGIKPSIEHYGCMVDLLGRAGQLAEAEELIVSMPEKPNAIIWGALLGACRTHKDLRRGERVFRQLIELEPRSGDRYKLAGHMFTATGEEEDAMKVRKLIKGKELQTTRGCSYIEIDGIVHEFMAGDINHCEARQIYLMLEELKNRIEKVGFVVSGEGVVDLEEEKEEAH